MLSNDCGESSVAADFLTCFDKRDEAEADTAANPVQDAVPGARHLCKVKGGGRLFQAFQAELRLHPTFGEGKTRNNLNLQPSCRTNTSCAATSRNKPRCRDARPCWGCSHRSASQRATTVLSCRCKGTSRESDGLALRVENERHIQVSR